MIFKFPLPQRISPRVENNQKNTAKFVFFLQQCTTKAATLPHSDYKKPVKRAAGIPIWYHSGRITEANSQRYRWQTSTVPPIRVCMGKRPFRFHRISDDK